jgi:hypothetical protein
MGNELAGASACAAEINHATSREQPKFDLEHFHILAVQ